MEKLGINYGLLIAQIFNVLLLLWLLRRFLYTPVLNMLNERTRRVQESLSGTDQVKEQLANAKRDYDAELARARQEAAAIIGQAQERARSQEAEIVAQARQEADRIRREGEDAANQRFAQLQSDFRRQAAELVTATATRVLGAELKSNHQQLINESLASLDRRN